MRMKADTKEKKEKIKQLNKEIANMKKENFEVFYQFEAEDKKKKSFVLSFDTDFILFCISFCVLTASLFMLMQSIEMVKLYVGESILPNWLLTLPLIFGMLMVYLMKEKAIPVITAVFGLLCVILIIMLGGGFSFVLRPVWQYVLIFSGILYGFLSYMILLLKKIKK